MFISVSSYKSGENVHNRKRNSGGMYAAFTVTVIRPVFPQMAFYYINILHCESQLRFMLQFLLKLFQFTG